MTMKHTPGAIRAAEIITRRKYDPTGQDQKRFPTEYGTKTVMGIAAIIERETAAPELLAALEAALPVVETDALRLIAAVDYNSEEAEGHLEGATTLADQVRAAIAKARGE